VLLKIFKYMVDTWYNKWYRFISWKSFLSRLFNPKYSQVKQGYTLEQQYYPVYKKRL